MMKTFKKLITCSVISGTILFSASIWSSVDCSSWIFRISYIVFLWCNICGKETIGFNVYILISFCISFVIPWLIRKKNRRLVFTFDRYTLVRFSYFSIFAWRPFFFNPLSLLRAFILVLMLSNHWHPFQRWRHNFCQNYIIWESYVVLTNIYPCTILRVMLPKIVSFLFVIT